MNSAIEQIFAQLKPQSTRQVIEHLAGLGTVLVGHGRSRPEVDLYLASGQTVRGRVVSLDGSHGSQGVTALVHTGGTATAPSVVFLRVDQVVAISIVDASLLAKPVMSDAPVPSKLALQRDLLARADGLGGTLGHPIKLELMGGDLDDDGRRAISLLLPLVQEVLHAIAADAIGKQALAKVASIELGSSNSLDVQLDGPRLVIRAPTLLSEQPTHAVLRTAIESRL